MEMTENSPILVENNELKRYLSIISKIKTLSQEEEYALALGWINDKDSLAAQKLVVSHLPLVVKVAYSYRGYGLSIMDLISEGTIGLMRAVEKFDPYKGNRLSTYALWWIKAYMSDYILNTWSLVKSGTQQGRKKLFFSLNRVKAKLGFSGGSLSKDEAGVIAKQTGTSLSDVIEVSKMISARDVYISSAVGSEDSGKTIADTIENTDSNPEEIFIEEEKKKNIQILVGSVFQILNDREKEILKKRYVLDKTLSLEEIGQSLGISRERVRQIESAALKKAKTFLLANNKMLLQK